MHETKPQTLFLESCSSNTVVELESHKKFFCRIFFKRLWKRDKKTATRISRSRLSQMNRRSPHSRLTISPRRRQSSLRPRLRQFISLSQSCRTQSRPTFSDADHAANIRNQDRMVQACWLSRSRRAMTLYRVRNPPLRDALPELN